jgi:hypothetical protein
MIRHAVAVAVALSLSPSWLYAQNLQFIVRTASADVHLSPSTGSPVIGNAPRGTVLEVTRELGSWVRIPWPAARDGVAFVHVSTGAIASGLTPSSNGTVPLTARRAAPRPAPPPATDDSTPPQTPAKPQSVSSTRTTYVTPSHVIGVGGRMGGMAHGFGATARAWPRKRLGLQLEVSRYGLTSVVTPGHATSIHFEPSVLYSLPDRVSSHVWLRPYIGAGANLHRQTLRLAGPTGADPLADGSDTRFGLQTFGGGEVTLASVPRFALSAELGYRWSRRPFAGIELGGTEVSLSGHWYIK